MPVLDLFLPRKLMPFLRNQALGYFFLKLGVLGGVFFFFQWLVPLVGYVKSGMIACGLLGFIGGLLLILSYPKKTLPREDFSQKILSSFKEIDMESLLKNHAVMVSLLSFGIGVVLSQLKDPRKFSELYKRFK